MDKWKWGMRCFTGFVLLLTGVFFPVKAYAYLDPGTGSYLFQILIAGLLTVSLSLKIFWRRISSWLRSNFSKSKHDKSK